MFLNHNPLPGERSLLVLVFAGLLMTGCSNLQPAPSVDIATSTAAATPIDSDFPDYELSDQYIDHENEIALAQAERRGDCPCPIARAPAQSRTGAGATASARSRTGTANNNANARKSWRCKSSVNAKSNSPPSWQPQKKKRNGKTMPGIGCSKACKCLQSTTAVCRRS